MSGASGEPGGGSARDELDRSFVRGVAWTGGIRWASQILTWIATIYVARLLQPSDYGLFGMAVVYLGFVRIVNEFGLGSAIVILRELPPPAIRQLNGLAVLLGIVWFGLSWLLAEPIAHFYRAPELTGIVLLMSVGFLIAPFRTIPGALLERDLQFRGLAFIEAAQGIVAAVATVVAARAGHGYRALVIGPLVGTAVASALAVAVRPQAFSLPRPATLRSTITIGWHILVGRVSWYVYSNADFLVAGRLLGKEALGFYSFALSLARIPLDRMAAMVQQVTPAVFSAVQDDRPALRRYVLGLSEALALVTMPATWGLALVAQELIPVLLGEKWLGAVIPLQILAFYASFRCLTPVLANVLNVTGDTRFGMWVGVLSALVLPTGFLVGSRWGVAGIAMAWLVLHPLVTLPNYVRVFRTLDISAGAYARALWPAVSSSLAMAAAVEALRRGLPAAEPDAMRLGLEIAVGAAAYAGALLTLHRATLRAALPILRRLRG
jgi:PST family polysaccharide transporter